MSHLQSFSTRLASQASEAEIDAFELAIAPLEVQCVEILSGPGHRDCLQAFLDDPVGFSALRDKFLQRTDLRSPLGTFVHAVREGEHLQIGRRLRRQQELVAGSGKATNEANALEATVPVSRFRIIDQCIGCLCEGEAIDVDSLLCERCEAVGDGRLPSSSRTADGGADTSAGVGGEQ
jgi:hypothetical protein